MTVLMISAFLSLIFGKKYLYNLSYAQSLLILIFWTNDVDQNMKEFASWLQFSKLDFGYLYYSGLNSTFNCISESTKMANLQFGCQSTVLNYFWVLLFFALSIIIYRLLDAFRHKIELISSMLVFIDNKFTSSLIVWMLIHIYYKLALINIIALDAEMMSNHALTSGVSIVIVVWVIVYFCLKHQLFSKIFIEGIDEDNSLSFTLTSAVQYSFLSCLFISESVLGKVIWAILYLWSSFINLLNQSKLDQKSLKMKTFQRFSNIIKMSFNLLIWLTVCFYKLSLNGADHRPLVLMTTWSLVLWFAVEFVSDLAEIVTKKILK